MLRLLLLVSVLFLSSPAFARDPFATPQLKKESRQRTKEAAVKLFKMKDFEVLGSFGDGFYVVKCKKTGQLFKLRLKQKFENCQLTHMGVICDE